MPLIPLSNNDGSWASLKAAWRAECEPFKEDFDSYAQPAFTVLDPLAAQPEQNAGIYGLDENGSIAAVCQVNCTPLPGHPDPVLRVRLMTFAPRYGNFEVQSYASCFSALLSCRKAPLCRRPKSSSTFGAWPTGSSSRPLSGHFPRFSNSSGLQSKGCGCM